MSTEIKEHLGYIDSFAGLIPCKIISLDKREVTVKVTAKRPGYKRGEIVKTLRTRVVYRSQVRTRNGQYRLIGSV